MLSLLSIYFLFWTKNLESIFNPIKKLFSLKTASPLEVLYVPIYILQTFVLIIFSLNMLLLFFSKVRTFCFYMPLKIYFTPQKRHRSGICDQWPWKIIWFVQIKSLMKLLQKKGHDENAFNEGRPTADDLQPSADGWHDGKIAVN